MKEYYTTQYSSDTDSFQFTTDRKYQYSLKIDHDPLFFPYDCPRCHKLKEISLTTIKAPDKRKYIDEKVKNTVLLQIEKIVNQDCNGVYFYCADDDIACRKSREKIFSIWTKELKDKGYIVETKSIFNNNEAQEVNYYLIYHPKCQETVTVDFYSCKTCPPSINDTRDYC